MGLTLVTVLQATIQSYSKTVDFTSYPFVPSPLHSSHRVVSNRSLHCHIHHAAREDKRTWVQGRYACPTELNWKLLTALCSSETSSYQQIYKWKTAFQWWALNMLWREAMPMLASPEMMGPLWWAVPDIECAGEGDAPCLGRAALQGRRRRHWVSLRQTPNWKKCFHGHLPGAVERCRPPVELMDFQCSQPFLGAFGMQDQTPCGATLHPTENE